MLAERGLALLDAPPAATQPISIATGTEAYAALKAEIMAAGLLERSMSFYLPLIFAAFAGYGLSALAIVLLHSYLPLALACLGFTFFGVQLAGLMHDSGHRAVFASKAMNNLLGYAASGAIGMVFPNWTKHHNQHHARPNQGYMDPDLEVPFVAIDADLFAAKDRFQRRLGRWQAFYYYPLGSIVGFSNRLGSLTFFLRNRSRANLLRFSLYLPAIVVLFVAPFAVFNIEKALFVFALVHISTGIYLANCFAPNHKGMPLVALDAELSFIEQQVITARSVSGGFLTDIMLVGLNHQIEHHLFPSTPRNKLPLLKPYVREACERLGVPYVEATFIETNRQILQRLHAASRSATRI